MPRPLTPQQAEDYKVSHANVGAGNKVMFSEILERAIDAARTGDMDTARRLRAVIDKAYAASVDNANGLYARIIDMERAQPGSLAGS